jgi:dCMP deaminase
MDFVTDKWHRRYLQLAETVAGWSKDPSRQIGCVAVNDKGQILSVGYNGFPRGINDDPVRLNNREEKYKFVVHAEKNMIYNATHNGVSLDGSTVYVSGLPVCSECAKGLIQVGVKQVIMDDATNIRDNWAESWELTRSLFDEARIKYKILEDKNKNK